MEGKPAKEKSRKKQQKPKTQNKQKAKRKKKPQNVHKPQKSQSPESLIRSREKRLAEVMKFNLMSDGFGTVALKDIPACQHVLRIITGISDLVVKEVRTQYRVSKITSHDAVLDILAEDGSGKLYNIELQRPRTIDHARRTRFYSSMVDSEFLQKGKNI